MVEVGREGEKGSGKNDHSKLNPLTKNQLDLDNSSMETNSIQEVNNWGQVGTHPKAQPRATKESWVHMDIKFNKLKEEETILKRKAKGEVADKSNIKKKLPWPHIKGNLKEDASLLNNICN